jgi:NADPH:quinone reductase-like Zn-dependent oxidoreductase
MAENMVHRANVVSGETVLITGAPGGVGAAAIQLCKRCGTKIVAVSGKDKAQRMLDLGANSVILQGESITGEPGKLSVEVVLDVVAGALLPKLLDVLNKGGRYATAGAIAGLIVKLDVRTLYLKDLSFFGCTFHEDVVFANLILYIEIGEIKPHVGQMFKLQDIRKAQEVFQSKATSEKLVLGIK